LGQAAIGKFTQEAVASHQEVLALSDKHFPQLSSVKQQSGMGTHLWEVVHHLVLGSVQTHPPHLSKLLGQEVLILKQKLLASHQVHPAFIVVHLPQLS
jgi:hypothetical protein